MRKTTVYLIVCALALSACTRESPVGAGEAVVRISAFVSGQGEATKAPVTGTAFPNNGTYGIFVCKHGTTDTAHKSNSWNIRALYSETLPGWTYYYVANLSSGAVASSGYDHITLTARDDEATADLYAYSPYTQSAFSSGLEAIPYTIVDGYTGQTDLMYAVENTTNANSNLDPTSASNLSATFTFRHAFSLLAFRFRLAHDSSNGGYASGTTYNLTDITVTLHDPDSDGQTTAKLYSSGTFNALSGTFNGDASTVTSLSVAKNLSISSATEYATAYLMLVPTEVADGELVFTFTMNGQTLQPFRLQHSQILHSDVPTYGLRSGYCYTFNFTLDNYLYFDGFTVSSDWTAETLGEMEI